MKDEIKSKLEELLRAARGDFSGRSTIPEQDLRLYQELADEYKGEWIDYEGYMKAGILEAEENKTGFLLVYFEKNTGIEKLGLHMHPKSDRQIIVLRGEGMYHEGSPSTSTSVREGSYIEFSKGTVHTFTTTDKDMLVFSVHRPFIEFDDEQCLKKYDDKDNF